MRIFSKYYWPIAKQRIKFESRRLSQLGIAHFTAKLFTKTFGVILWILLLPATLGLHLAGYRRVTIFTDRIGHLALEPCCLIKEQRLGIIKKRRWIILAPPQRTANRHLLSYWQPYFLIVRNPLLCYLIDSMSKWILMRHDISHYARALGKTQAAYGIFDAWGDRPPIVQLRQEDEEWGKDQLLKLGLPDGAWFVCAHAREPGFSPIDEELHSHRNGKIKNLVPAIEEITNRGGWVIRVGDQSMEPLPELSNVIDYATHPAKSDRLDVILCAKCTFILGNTSGIAIVGTIFGTPSALANIIPITAPGFGRNDLNIPKRVWSVSLSSYLNFRDILSSEIALFTYASDYLRHGLRPVENTPEDISLLVKEMFSKLQRGTDPAEINDQLKEASLYIIKYKICRGFISQNISLFPKITDEFRFRFR
jgi:putative glycosyltransferase (TIGR04372 family)